ncbi:MAG: hypothetical protein AMS22_05060 [Thiotrichales bacterium SG8_50]|nr:MAG: hypothetical protein AMS22_05060 [Thiotrichales bacterium SG8_50]
MENLIVLGLAVAATSMTISTTHAGAPLRAWVSKNGPWFEKLIHCPWCVSHWLSLALTPLWMQVTNLAQWAVYTMSVVAISGLASAGIAYLFLALDALEGE